MSDEGTFRKPFGNSSMGIKKGRDVRVIAVTSGKGGVGKTNVVGNLAYSIAALGKKVMVLDADLGLGDFDILFGLNPRFNLTDVITGRKKIHEVVINGPGGIKVLPAVSDPHEVTELSNGQKANLLSQMDELEEEIDFLLIDTGTGISSNVMFFNMAAHEILVVITPEPTSINDASTLIKLLAQHYSEDRFQLLINSVKSETEAKSVYRDFCTEADRFLTVSIDYLGYILHDPDLALAVREQKAIVEIFPDAPASICFRKLASEMVNRQEAPVCKGNIQFFGKRIFEVA
jgi:flagellar biosynthesis protein FlhG